MKAPGSAVPVLMVLALSPLSAAGFTSGREIHGVRISISAVREGANLAEIRVGLQNTGREQRLVTLGWTNEGTVAPAFLDLLVSRGGGWSYSVSCAKPTALPGHPDPVSIPLTPGGRYRLALSPAKYQVIGRNGPVVLARFLSEEGDEGCTIEVQLKMRIPYCRDASAPDGCWEGTLVSNELRFPN